MYSASMGKRIDKHMAPNFSNVFVAHPEERFQAAEAIKPLAWERYIKDIFMIWNGSDEQLEYILIRLNSVHPMIKFTYEINNDTQTVMLGMKV
jgi:hypothetical protein